MIRQVQDRTLPPDREAFIAADPPTGRVIVIAPTRAACETIELALSLNIETFLEKHHGAEVRELAAAGRGFGIVAGTGTGKTLAVRPIAEQILRAPLRVGVVNREREATPDTPSWNVIIVTTGIARRWFQDGDILPGDTLVVDEIHQTSAELELCLALGKRVGCRYIWLSATVDPTFYSNYLDSSAVVESFAFDPDKAADVVVVNREPLTFLDDDFLRQLVKEKRGVAMFVPTRAGVEQAAEWVRTHSPRVNVAFYHGGEPIRIIRPFLEGGEKKPYFLSMTAAGQSALNVQGLDTVIIHDSRFTNIVERGKNVLTRSHLGANEILQMAGRVHGRVANGRVFILSDRRIEFRELRPTAPEFQLAGDAERVAMTCADLGVRADDLDLPVPLDKRSYREALARLEGRGIIENGRLSAYGKAVEALPVDRAWAELLVHADDDLVPYLAVTSSIDSLHRMTRDERDLSGVVVPGSDHLTSYNLYAEAYREAGYIGEVYGLPRQLFREEPLQEWAEQRGVLVKSIEDAALAMASVYRSLGLPLPDTMPRAHDSAQKRFMKLIAQYMPFDLVIDEQTADGREARVSKTSVCGSWGAVAGTLRYFADRFGNARASIEGTQLSMELVRRHATRSTARITYNPGRRAHPLAIERTLEYYGFELEREAEPIDVFPAEHAGEIRRVMAEAVARGEARHPSARRNQEAVEMIREVYRRSAGTTARLGLAELASIYESQLAQVNTVEDFRATPLVLDVDALVPRAEREKYLALPDAVELRGRTVDIDYDVESGETGAVGVARLRLPEKLARTLAAEELPELDRPLRFVVTRGQRGAVRANTLDELKDLLERPWTDDELQRVEREQEKRREERQAARRDRRGREIAREMRGVRRVEGTPGGEGEAGGRKQTRGSGRGGPGRGGPPGKRGGARKGGGKRRR